MRLLICGGRDFTDVEYAVTRFHHFHLKNPVSVLISGMARGGDSIGVAWANEVGIPVEPYPVTKEDWERHGKAAGSIRNQQMRDVGKPDHVLALPGGNGTANMVELAQEFGIPVTIYRYRLFSGAKDPVNGFQSNFYPHEQVDEDGLIYPTNEHYYQAKKAASLDEFSWVLESATPGEAKRRGKQITMRPDWEDRKFDVMMNGLRMKFITNSPLADRLIHTGDDYIVEFAPWGDRVWGVAKDMKGLNWLGRLLMRRRDEILKGKLYE